MEPYTSDEKDLMRMIVKKTQGTKSFFQKVVSENFFNDDFRPIMLLDNQNNRALLFFSENGMHSEFNRFMNLVALMEDLEEDRLIIRLNIADGNTYFVGELWDATETKCENGETQYRSKSSGKYIRMNEWDKLHCSFGGPSEVLHPVKFDDPKTFNRLSRAFSGLVYPRETLIDLVTNKFQSVTQRRHKQTMFAAWFAIALSVVLSLASLLSTIG